MPLHELIDIVVITRSQQSGISLDAQNRILCRVVSPPERGKANKEVIKIFAELLQIAPSRIAIMRGSATRNKTIGIVGLTKESIVNALLSVERFNRRKKISNG